MAEDMTAQVREHFGRAAVGWERWSGMMQRDDGARYIEAAGVASGDRVLEVGAGTGEQTLELAARVGPRGTVVATDLSPEMLDVGSRRISDAGFDNVEFIASGVDTLNLEEATFDACVSGFTWEFLPDPRAAAVSVRRLLTPGGRFAASAWAEAAHVPMRAIVGTVVLSELGIPLPEEAGGIGLADPDRFSEVLSHAGFEDVSVTELPVVMRWASPTAYAQCMGDLAPQLHDLIEVHDPQRVEEIWAAVADAVSQHTEEDGTVRLVNRAFLGTGARPV